MPQWELVTSANGTRYTLRNMLPLPPLLVAVHLQLSETETETRDYKKAAYN